MAAKRLLLLLILMTATLLVACDGNSDKDDEDTPAAANTDAPAETNSSSGDSAAAEAVLHYLEAKVNSDEDTIRALLCADMEGDLSRESASFASVEASLEDAACEVGESDGDYTLVTCTGSIEALYGAENRSFPLSTYRTVQEDGEWKYCGEG